MAPRVEVSSCTILAGYLSGLGCKLSLARAWLVRRILATLVGGLGRSLHHGSGLMARSHGLLRWMVLTRVALKVVMVSCEARIPTHLRCK